MKVGDYVRYRIRQDRFDGLLGRIVSIGKEDYDVEILENSTFIGPLRRTAPGPAEIGDVEPADPEELILVSPLELLAMEAEDETACC